MRINFVLIAFSIGITLLSKGQLLNYKYRLPIESPKEQWHYIDLPEQIFGAIKSDFSDIRIFGVNAANDTFEAPYFLYNSGGVLKRNKINFTLINQSKASDGYYYTFKVPKKTTLNEAKLTFAKTNFDWLIDAEGSNNQKEWYKFLEGYRVLSIKTDQTDYQFTTLKFPQLEYDYIRIHILSKVNPEFTSAELSNNEYTPTELITYSVKTWSSKVIKEDKQSVIEINLGRPLPISFIDLKVNNPFDYYRPITIQYLSDSFNTPKGWQYNYASIGNAVLSSVEKSEFNCGNTLAQKFKIIIDNKDNLPLDFTSVIVKGIKHRLLVRFDVKNATYFLTYGNPSAGLPDYDIQNFPDKVPTTISTLKVENQAIEKKVDKAIDTPLIKNKIWLWLLMLAIILILGWFTYTMLRKQ